MSGLILILMIQANSSWKRSGLNIFATWFWMRSEVLFAKHFYFRPCCLSLMLLIHHQLQQFRFPANLSGTCLSWQLWCTCCFVAATLQKSVWLPKLRGFHLVEVAAFCDWQFVGRAWHAAGWRIRLKNYKSSPLFIACSATMCNAWHSVFFRSCLVWLGLREPCLDCTITFVLCPAIDICLTPGAWCVINVV